MKCLTPIAIENRKYQLLKDFTPSLTRYMLVPCGKCLNCLKNKVSEWSTRLEFEANSADTSFFVTLTYSDDSLPKDGVNKRDVQLFHKRIRKAGFKFKFYLISEYTPQHQRPHYHGLYFGLPDYVFKSFWKFGFSDVREIIPQRISYVASYHVLKNFNVPAGQNANFRLCSQGLGLNWFNDRERKNAFINDYMFLVNNSGYMISLPRYFKKKCDVMARYLSPGDNIYSKYSKSRVKAKNFNSAIFGNLSIYINRKLKLKSL